MEKSHIFLVVPSPLQVFIHKKSSKDIEILLQRDLAGWFSKIVHCYVAGDFNQPGLNLYPILTETSRLAQDFLKVVEVYSLATCGAPTL